MANEPSQNPAAPALALGLGSQTIGFAIRESQDEETTANLEYVKDETGNDAVAVVSNKGKRLSLNGYLLANAAVPAIGDTITLGGTNGARYLVESVRVSRTATLCRVAVSVYKPDATAWAAAV